MKSVPGGSKMKRLSFTIITIGILALALVRGSPAVEPVSPDQPEPAIELAIRCDDVGMCHTGNMAIRKLVETGIPFSASVMVACPWYLEAAEILRDQPQVSVGIHLTLNSEWEHYKWGPVLGRSRVPTLVDENGHFHSTEAAFAAGKPDLGEVEMELRAQIERARQAGLRIDYLDYHMLTAVSTPELRAIVEGLASEYGFGLAMYFNERSASLWDVAPRKKFPTLLDIVGRLLPGRPTLLVMHVGLETPEMKALVDVNNPQDPYRVAQHRQAELEALSSPAFRRAISDRGIKLTTYREIIEQRGLAAMVRPEGAPGYSMDDGEE
jgi:predicted glycoside hydrolase/deacetylase ChbG (UPF0249 family)